VTGDEERELEEWTVRAKSEMLRDVFDLDVTMASSSAGGSGKPSQRPDPASGAAPASQRPGPR
jgi:hypothetical protein